MTQLTTLMESRRCSAAYMLQDSREFAVGALDILSLRVGEIHILHLAGDLDLAAESEFLAVVREVVGDGPDEIVFDLGDVDFIDARGIYVLVTACAEAPEDCVVKISRCSEAVRRVVRLTGISSRLPPMASADPGWERER